MPVYRLHIRGFWKLSSIVHTCGSSNISRQHGEDELLFQEITHTLAEEHISNCEFLRNVSDIAKKDIEDKKNNNIIFPVNFRVGRGLDIYDSSVHENLSKLPYLVVQQYISPRVPFSSNKTRGGKLLGCLDEVIYYVLYTKNINKVYFLYTLRENKSNNCFFFHNYNWK